jgi:hypothetical protein
MRRANYLFLAVVTWAVTSAGAAPPGPARDTDARLTDLKAKLQQQRTLRGGAHRGGTPGTRWFNGSVVWWEIDLDEVLLEPGQDKSRGAITVRFHASVHEALYENGKSQSGSSFRESGRVTAEYRLQADGTVRIAEVRSVADEGSLTTHSRGPVKDMVKALDGKKLGGR